MRNIVNRVQLSDALNLITNKTLAMKKSIILYCFLLVSVYSFSQCRDTVIVINNNKVNLHYDLSWGKEKLNKFLDNVRTYHINNSQKLSTSIKTILSQIPLSPDGCSNGGFESGYTGWTGLSLKHVSEVLPIEDGLSTNPGIVTLPMTNLAWGGNYTNIESTGTDGLLSTASPSFSMQRVKSGSKALRLGNNEAGYGAEGVAKRFLVTAANAIYYFQYAIVMDKSHSAANGSMNGSEVFFIAMGVDMTGNTIDKVVEVGNPSNPFISATNNGSIFYRNWRCCSLDLSSRIGQEVVVMFINSDCSRSAHKGYTYLDAVCEPCTNINEGDININLAADSCVTFPLTIGGTFTLPASGLAQNRNITLQVFQNNTLVGTITNPIITGANYSFTLSPSDFPNQSNGQCYDLVSRLSFDYPGINGQLQPVVQLSSNPVMGVQDGVKPGINNDVCFCSNPGPCCNIANLTAALSENNGVYNLALNAGSVPIQEVEISMIDYHAVYNEPDCKPLNMGSNGGNIGNMTTTTLNLSSLVLSTTNNNQNNSHVLTWLPGSAAIINNQISFTVQKPAVLNLTCCNVQFWFCIKLRVKDINCNVCEKILCYPSTPAGVCDCKGTGWIKDKPVNIMNSTGQSVGSVPCGGTGSVTLQKNVSYQFNAPPFACNPARCLPTYKWKILQGTSVVGSGTGNPFSYTFTTAGTFVVTITPYCGNLSCDPCKFTVIIREPQGCDCSGTGWIKDKPFVVQTAAGQVAASIPCDGNLTLPTIGSYQFTAPGFLCSNPAACPTSYKWEVTGSATGTGSGTTFAFNFPVFGPYTIVVTPYCGTQPCQPCKLNINIRDPKH